MNFVMDSNCPSDLFYQLVCVPPSIALSAWINDFTSIVNDISILVSFNQPASAFRDEIRDMDQATSTFLLQNSLSFCKPCRPHIIKSMKTTFIMEIGNNFLDSR